MEDIPDPAASIETSRLRLRAPRPEDATALCAMMTPHVSRWLASWPVPFTAAMAAERITAALGANADGRALLFVIERRLDGVPVGWIGVVKDEPAGKKGMLGYWLGEAHQGHGYMREAATAALASCFARLGLEVVEAAAQPENIASFAVMRACGMIPAGECLVFAPARGREELCLRYEATRPE